jgi:trimethylguanosine synthase
VIAIDNSPVRLALARHNAVIYGVHDRIEFVLADFPSWARSFQSIQTRAKPSVDAEEQPSISLKLPVAQSKIDIVFLSPPWGGPSYISTSLPKESSSSFSASDKGNNNGNEEEEEPHPNFTLDMTTPLPGDELFTLARNITPHVAYYLPRNTDISQISKLVDGGSGTGEKIEIEEEWMGMKLKALTVYFGGLVKGQEHLWAVN